MCPRLWFRRSAGFGERPPNRALLYEMGRSSCENIATRILPQTGPAVRVKRKKGHSILVALPEDGRTPPKSASAVIEALQSFRRARLI